jgi:hypothetical protein
MTQQCPTCSGSKEVRRKPKPSDAYGSVHYMPCETCHGTGVVEQTEERSTELCGATVHWWDGEYDGECELPKGHLEPFHYDGVSYYDDDENPRDSEQERFQALLASEKQASYEQGVDDTIKKYVKGDYTAGMELAIDKAVAELLADFDQSRTYDADGNPYDYHADEWYKDALAALQLNKEENK